jgi:CDP-diacylglycerol--serine O-phosphatidyltransferase
MGALTRQYAEQNSKFAKPEHGQKRHAAQPRLLDANRRDVQHTEQEQPHRAYYLGVPVTASAVLAPLFYLLSLRFALNCAVVYALGLFLLGVLYITPLHVKKPQLRGVAFLSVFGLGEFAVLLRVLTR